MSTLADPRAHDHQSAQRNRLAGESSPYLLLHQANPVDWYPWGEEALSRSRAEDRPIFLSVGYSTCYWCHVMERESFSNPEVAALMNRHFVNVKVDREERPDLDEIYMAATQILTGQGGWPNSVFLTPDLKPFYAGTYFPPVDRYGRPGFSTLVLALADAWKNRRPDIHMQADELAGAMRRFLEERVQPGERPPGPEAARRAAEALARQFDRDWGGFGSAPKFPTPANLYLLQELVGLQDPADEDAELGRMLTATLDAMARGGLYDQLGGGFHRYATDREWKVPHFEKMLYDNGMLLEVYATEHARTGEPEWSRIALETAEFLAREMTLEDGSLASAIDAETESEEGAYYVWSRAELEAVLGPEDATFLAPLLGFDGRPFFEGGRYVLHLPQPLAEQAAARRSSREALLAEMAPGKARLLAARGERPRPLTDDKVLADWNGTAIAGLAEAGHALDRPDLIERAARAANAVLATLRPSGGTLLHAARGGRGKLPAFLADYAFLVRGLLALDRAQPGAGWLETARQLTEEQIRRLRDLGGGFFAAAASPDLLFRSKEVFDGALPAANAVAALNLIELAARTGEPRWRDEAAATLTAFAPLVERFPEAVRMLALAARRFASLPGSAATGAPAGAPAKVAGPRQGIGLGAGALAAEAAQVVTATVEAGPTTPAGRELRVKLEIAPGWHLQANPGSLPELAATRVEAEGAELAAVRYPPGRSARLAFAGEEVAVYEGEVEVFVTLSGERDGAAVLLTFQACDDSRCLPPVMRRLPLPR